MKGNYPFDLSLHPSLVRLVLHHEYRKRMNDEQGTTIVNKTQRITSKTTAFHVSQPDQPADMAALEQIACMDAAVSVLFLLPYERQ